MNESMYITNDKNKTTDKTKSSDKSYIFSAQINFLAELVRKFPRQIDNKKVGADVLCMVSAWESIKRHTVRGDDRGPDDLWGPMAPPRETSMPMEEDAS